MSEILKLRDVSAGYSKSTVLEGISMDVEENSVTTLLGRNGVGKTTTLRAITGIIEPREGSVAFDGADMTGVDPNKVYKRGVGMVTEDRNVFPELTVVENLRVPRIRDRDAAWSIDELYEFFPKLRQLQDSKGKNLSGGEQQMLAIARALRPGPKLLLLDEPSEGLAPQIVEDVADIIEEIAETGTTVLLVEQNIELALNLASYNYVMDLGKIVHEGPTSEIEGNRDVLENYLGVKS
jgi:branched-chain amino acid transport system ATP-binding protein